MEKIGLKIRKIRELKNITQDYVAKQLAISQASYSIIESGRAKVSEEKLTVIASILDVSPEKIATFNELDLLSNPIINHDSYSESGLSLAKIVELYEKLLLEKDRYIEILEKQLHKR
jgi:transcriptional regulator with XRE-family HTH domain